MPRRRGRSSERYVDVRLLFVLGMVLALLALVPAAQGAAPRPKIDFVRTFGGGEGDDTVHGFALAPDGAVYVGGHAHGPSLLGQPTADAADVFVARFGKGGKFQWARMLKGTGDDFLFGLAAGPGDATPPGPGRPRLRLRRRLRPPAPQSLRQAAAL